MEQLPEELLQHTFSYLFNFLVGDYKHPFELGKRYLEGTPTSSKVQTQENLFPKKTTRARKAEAIKQAKEKTKFSTQPVVSKPELKTFKIAAQMIKLSNVCRAWKDAINNTDVFWGTSWYLVQVTHFGKSIASVNQALVFTPMDRFEIESKKFVSAYAATCIIDKIQELLGEIAAMKDNYKLFHDKDFVEKEEKIIKLLNASAITDNAAPKLSQPIQQILEEMLVYGTEPVKKSNYKSHKRTLLNVFREIGKRGGMCLGSLIQSAYEKDPEFIPVILELWHFYHQHQETGHETSPSSTNHARKYSCTFHQHVPENFLINEIWTNKHDMATLKILLAQTDKKYYVEKFQQQAVHMFQIVLREAVDHPDLAKEMLSYLVNDLRLQVPPNPDAVLLPSLCTPQLGRSSTSQLLKFQPVFDYAVGVLGIKLTPPETTCPNLLIAFVGSNLEAFSFLFETLMKGKQKQLKAWAEKSCDNNSGGIIEHIIRNVAKEKVPEAVRLIMKTGASESILFNKTAKKAFNFAPAAFREYWQANVKHKFV